MMKQALLHLLNETHLARARSSTCDIYRISTWTLYLVQVVERVVLAAVHKHHKGR
ncbi:hypothetical protein PIB30_115538, partial [Stylosanthes scabra]|nr:hypothetical protein [Stylosanthes scabra]